MSTNRGLFRLSLSEEVNYIIYNIYQKNGYDASVSGPFLKLGTLYMLANDIENPMNGFFVGGKVAGSYYQQEYKEVHIRGFGGSDIY